MNMEHYEYYLDNFAAIGGALMLFFLMCQVLLGVV